MKTYLFPGQGSQIKGMGSSLFDAFPKLTQKADKLLGYSIKDLCLENKDNQLNQTQYTQPALYVVNALSYQQKLQASEDKPDFVAGHSLGEYNALEAAGAISFEVGLKLVKKRGELMSQAPQGAMAAILEMTVSDVQQCLHDNGLTSIDIANYNAPSQIVISGLRDDINQAQTYFEKAGGLFIPLNTSGAFHSRYMETAKTQFEKYLKKFKFSKPEIPVISNVYAKPYQQNKIVSNLAEQITHSVKWLQSIQYLLEQGGMAFEELGVGDVLTKLVATIQADFTADKQAEKNRKDKNKVKQAKAKEVAKAEEVEQNQQTVADPVDSNSASSKIVATAPKVAHEKETQSVDKRIAAWNDSYPIGTQVTVVGYEDALETRSQAMVLFGHRAAIYMKGYNGYFALDEVTPAGEYA